uniref:CCR4-NOT transcription complex subunit 4 n=1 Tax=Dendroctonus ponderosae TaxID=77166 RepID=A0AAR5PXD5_DENPD
MSVLNQSGEEQVECPLCMESLEVDDLNFFPCTCGYQICRFCWHRIRHDENGGLCPACRKPYSENPADFIPLTQEQMAKMKADKRQRDQQRKAKLTESRKHLSSVRVVQRNLVFVVGLPPRLADPEILKRHEYFGKFGKIHKVVINQSTSYAGSQGPSASAYVTYIKSDDALRAIQAVNNFTIDNRSIKSSLGTTKYCSHFLKNQPCPKPDCMYLHEYGDPEASFTREQMHLGKHQEYEKKLHEDLLARTKTQNGQGVEIKGVSTAKVAKDANNSSNTSKDSTNSSGTNKENWPQLDKDKKQEKDKPRKGKTKNNAESRSKDKKEGKNSSSSECRSSQDSRTTSTSSNSSHCCKIEAKDSDTYPSPGLSSESSPSSSPPSTQSPPLNRSNTPLESSPLPTNFNASPTGSYSSNVTSFVGKLPPNLVGRSSEDCNSYFSSSGFSKLQNSLGTMADKEEHIDRDRISRDSSMIRPLGECLPDDHGHQVLTDTLPNINTTEDWAAAFGFTGQTSRDQELLQQKLQQRDMSKFASFLNTEAPEPAFGKGVENLNGFYELAKFQENLMDALATKANGFKEQSSPSSPYQNGYSNGVHSSYPQFLHQKHLEEQFRNLALKQNTFSGAQTTLYQNSIPTPTYLNGDASLVNGGVSSMQNLYSKTQGVSQQPPNNSRNSEAELDFDPFQVTQKGFAEIMATEQNIKQHNSGLSTGRSNQMNGLVHSQNNTHIPPPPPGFLQQQQAHMNSFGSKILPFLSMSNSQQQLNNAASNWPNSFNSQLQEPKNVSNTCNDWKVLDPAILSSSRSYQLPTVPPVPDAYNIPPLANQQITHNSQLRSYDYPPSNNPFSTFAQQPNYNSFTQLNTPQNVNNLNWFTANDINSQISSPPGFRNNQTSKQQEC